MKIVLAPDKFKGCLRADEVADAMAEGIRRVDPGIEIDSCPVADGGEGTVDALVRATGGRFVTRRVTGPLPEMKIDARFGLLGGGRTAVIEMAAASGLHLLRRDEYDPSATTTFGTGELIRFAVQTGCTRIILGIGGSATIDGGIGCAQACGFTILTRDGSTPAPSEPLCGRDLDNVLMVKHGRGEVTNGTEIVVACDVNNPLTGPTGAARTFGPQKGATSDQIKALDAWLSRLATQMDAEKTARAPGAGAAGGLGFGMLAYFRATLRPGVDLVLDALNMRKRLTGATLCLTGEGRLDASSLFGKAPIGVARLCKAAGVPCAAVVGSASMDETTLRQNGIVAAFPLIATSEAESSAIQDARRLIADRVEEVVNLSRSDAELFKHRVSVN